MISRIAEKTTTTINSDTIITTAQPAATTTTTTHPNSSSTTALKKIELADIANIIGAINTEDPTILGNRLYKKNYDLNQSGLKIPLIRNKNCERFIEYCTIKGIFILIPTLITFGEKAKLCDLEKIPKKEKYIDIIMEVLKSLNEQSISVSDELMTQCKKIKNFPISEVEVPNNMLDLHTLAELCSEAVKSPTIDTPIKVGDHIAIYWDGDNKYYPCIVKAVDDSKISVLYYDNTKNDEIITGLKYNTVPQHERVTEEQIINIITEEQVTDMVTIPSTSLKRKRPVSLEDEASKRLKPTTTTTTTTTAAPSEIDEDAVNTPLIQSMTLSVPERNNLLELQRQIQEEERNGFEDEIKLRKSQLESMEQQKQRQRNLIEQQRKIIDQQNQQMKQDRNDFETEKKSMKETIKTLQEEIQLLMQDKGTSDSEIQILKEMNQLTTEENQLLKQQIEQNNIQQEKQLLEQEKQLLEQEKQAIKQEKQLLTQRIDLLEKENAAMLIRYSSFELKILAQINTASSNKFAEHFEKIIREYNEFMLSANKVAEKLPIVLAPNGILGQIMQFFKDNPGLCTEDFEATLMDYNKAFLEIRNSLTQNYYRLCNIAPIPINPYSVATIAPATTSTTIAQVAATPIIFTQSAKPTTAPVAYQHKLTP